MAKRRVALRGRSLVALGLVGFVLIATGVSWRRAAGISQAADLRALEQQVIQLEAQQARLESEIREASSRSTLAPVVERRLGMRVPSDTQVVIQIGRASCRERVEIAVVAGSIKRKY